MRRILFAIGFCLVCAPVAVSAEALSPWVQKVMDRVDMGLSAAGTLGSTTCDIDKDDKYIADAEAAIRDSIDVRQQITRQQAYLRENTVCFQSDLDLLEDKIDEIRVAITDAVDACEIDEMRALRDILHFAVEAYFVLANGGTDPITKTDSLLIEYFWESEDRLNSGSGSELTDTHKDEPQCPYTTDYSPHSVGYVLAESNGATIIIGGGSEDVKSYGCDKDALAGIQEQTDEVTGMLVFLNGDGTDEGTVDFATNLSTMVSQFLSNLNFTIDALRGTTTTITTPTIPPPAPHDEITGCLRPSMPLVLLDPDESTLETTLDDFPDYFDAQYMREIEIAPGIFFITFNPPPDEALPVGMFLRPSYDYFSVFSNAISLQRRFTGKKTVLGNNRPLPLKVEAGSQFANSTYLVVYGPDAAAQYRDIATSIDEQTGFVEAAGRDALERTMDAYAPLQTAITTLSEVVDEELPDYIADFGYFMLRQCVSGHCSAVDGTLDTMVKRIYNPSCHPYVSGEYTDPRVHIKCFCIEKSDEEPDGLDVAGCDCGGTPQGGDCQIYCAYCQPTPSQEEQEKYSSMEPALFPGCRVEQGDPDTGY